MPHSPCVAIIDDDDKVRRFFEDVLEEKGYGYRSFCSCADALSGLCGAGADTTPPDLIFSDVRMDGMNGFEFLRSLRNAKCNTPVVLISGHFDLSCAMEAIGYGAADYLLKPTLPDAIESAIARHLSPCETEGRGRTPAELAFSMDLFKLTNRTMGRQLAALSNSMSEKRVETLEHSRRVASYAVLTGRRIAQVDLKELEIGAMLHDIGKVGVPENVLNKAGSLNREEWRIMKLHAAIGRDLLMPIPGMENVAEMVYSHHENFNGTGYPRGLAGEEISLSARIFSVVDAFDAITSDRPYRAARSSGIARAELRRMSGTQFDPAVVEAFLGIPDSDLQAIMRLSGELSVPN